MNFSLLSWLPLASHTDAINDDGIDEWFGGEAWVSLQPLGIECVGSANDRCVEEPADDWIPL